MVEGIMPEGGEPPVKSRSKDEGKFFFSGVGGSGRAKLAK